MKEALTTAQELLDRFASGQSVMLGAGTTSPGIEKRAAVLASDGHGNVMILGSTAEGKKSVMPDHSDLTVGLATKAFELIGKDAFSVSARLSVEQPESLRNFGLFESILLMAYNEGKADAARS